jgi:hypothetical protein
MFYALRAGRFLLPVFDSRSCTCNRKGLSRDERVERYVSFVHSKLVVEQIEVPWKIDLDHAMSSTIIRSGRSAHVK